MRVSSKATAEQLRLAHRGGAADSQLVHARPEQLLGGGMRAGGLSSPALQRLDYSGPCIPGHTAILWGGGGGASLVLTKVIMVTICLNLHIRERTFIRQ